MAGEGIEVQIEGIDAAVDALLAVTPQLRKKILPTPLRKAGRVISGEAKRLVPVLSVATKTRKPGTVKKAISVRTSKNARKAGDVGVFIGVKPAKGAKFKSLGVVAGVKLRAKVRASKRGAKSQDDPYYWRYVEFGTKHMRARPFLGPAADNKGAEALAVFARAVVPQIQKMNRGRVA